MIKYLFLSVVIGFFFGLVGSYMRLNILPVTEISDTEVKEFSQFTPPSGDSSSLSTKPNDIKIDPTRTNLSNEDKKNSPNAEELRDVLQEIGIDVTEDVDLEMLIERFGPLLESQNNLELNSRNDQSLDNMELTDLIDEDGQMPSPDKIRENLEAIGIEIPANINIEDFIKDFQPPVGNNREGGGPPDGGPPGGGPPNENMLRLLLDRAGVSVPENATFEELIQLMRENGIGRGRC